MNIFKHAAKMSNSTGNTVHHHLELGHYHLFSGYSSRAQQKVVPCQVQDSGVDNTKVLTLQKSTYPSEEANRPPLLKWKNTWVGEVWEKGHLRLTSVHCEAWTPFCWQVKFLSPPIERMLGRAFSYYMVLIFTI